MSFVLPKRLHSCLNTIAIYKAEARNISFSLIGDKVAGAGYYDSNTHHYKSKDSHIISTRLRLLKGLDLDGLL